MISRGGAGVAGALSGGDNWPRDPAPVSAGASLGEGYRLSLVPQVRAYDADGKSLLKSWGRFSAHVFAA